MRGQIHAYRRYYLPTRAPLLSLLQYSIAADALLSFVKTLAASRTGGDADLKLASPVSTAASHACMHAAAAGLPDGPFAANHLFTQDAMLGILRPAELLHGRPWALQLRAAAASPLLGTTTFDYSYMEFKSMIDSGGGMRALPAPAHRAMAMLHKVSAPGRHI